MPPKTASTGRPQRRTPSNIAPKSIPKHTSALPIDRPPHPPSTSTAHTVSTVPPQPPTPIPTSMKPAPRTSFQSSSSRQEEPQKQTRARKPVPPTQSVNSQKTLDTDSGLVIRDAKPVKNNEETVTPIETKKTRVEDDRPENYNKMETERSVNGGGNDVVLSSTPVLRSHVKDAGLTEPIARTDSEPGPGSGKRKIVRKTVRVVKKVIKRRVPKRVLLDDAENQGLLVKSGNGEDLNEVIESSNPVNSVSEISGHENDVMIEKSSHLNEVKEISNIPQDLIKENTNLDDVTESSNLMNVVTQRTSGFSEGEENPNFVNDVKETLDIECDARVSETIVGGDGNDLNGIEGEGRFNIVDDVMETSNIDKVARVSETIVGGDGNVLDGIDIKQMEPSTLESSMRILEPVVGDEYNDPLSLYSSQMRTSNKNSDMGLWEQMIEEEGHGQSGIHYMDTDDVDACEFMPALDRSNLGVCISDSMEAEMVSLSSISSMTSERMMEIAGSQLETLSKDSCLESQGIGIADKEDIGPNIDHSMGPGDEKRMVYLEQSGIPAHETNKGEETDTVGLNEGLLLSGEMEALERKKRRKTEIFVGGLDKDAKEDDVRRVFEKAGTVIEVRLMRNNITGKNKGFAFVRFAEAFDAKNALEKFSNVEICGKQCGALPVVGNDTIFLGNIDRKWKNEDVVTLLERAGIAKIDKVTLKPDPNDIEKNRGFAFVEFETCRDAEFAFHKLQKKNVFGTNLNIKVAWAEPLIEPSEEEILKVKSVYAEYLPPSWTEEKVKEYFSRFGEIESVAHSKDLHSSKRKDFAFINYTSREAALKCLETVNREKDSGSKIGISVSLAKPISKGKQMRRATDHIGKQPFKEKPKALQASIKMREPSNKGKLAPRTSHDHARFDAGPSTTNELVRILRQQASSNPIPPRPSLDTSIPQHHCPLPGSKRPFSLAGPDSLYLEPRSSTRPRMESYMIPGPSSLSHGVSMPSFSQRHQRGLGYTESSRPDDIYPSRFQSREQSHYDRNSSLYRRYW